MTQKILAIVYAIIPVLVRLAYALDPQNTKDVLSKIIDMLDDYQKEEDK